MPSTAAKRICIVDDEPEFADLLGSLLNMHGYQVHKINDPAQGWEHLSSQAYDGVILDIMMPGIDGLTLAGKLRGSAVHAHTPLFILSAKKLSDAERKFIHTQDIHFMPKPFTTRRLLEIIETVLAER